MQHTLCATYRDISIRPLYEADIELLRHWRNNKDLSKFLTPMDEITSDMQKKWYESYLMDDDCIFFAVIDREQKKTIGTVAIYDFCGNVAEVGKIVIGDDTMRGKGIGYTSLFLAMCAGFHELNLNCFRLRVFEENTVALNLYKKIGFCETGRHQNVGNMTELDMWISRDKFFGHNRMGEEVVVYKECDNDTVSTIESSSLGGGIERFVTFGKNCIISSDVHIGKGTTVGHNVIIEDGVSIGEDCVIESNCMIKRGVVLGSNSYVGVGCIIGERQIANVSDAKKTRKRELHIGNGALLRSGTILYEGSRIGAEFETGHRVTIREKTDIGDCVRIGTLSDIQGHCRIGSYVRMHSNVHIGMKSEIEDYVWIFPYVVLTNDPTPPSENLVGVHIHSFAVVSTGSVILPGVDVGQDALIGAGAVVTRNVAEYKVVAGNPAKEISDVRKIKNKITGEPAYPWRYHYSKSMPWNQMAFDEWYENCCK